MPGLKQKAQGYVPMAKNKAKELLVGKDADEDGQGQDGGQGVDDEELGDKAGGDQDVDQDADPDADEEEAGEYYDEDDEGYEGDEGYDQEDDENDQIAVDEDELVKDVEHEEGKDGEDDGFKLGPYMKYIKPIVDKLFSSQGNNQTSYYNKNGR